MAEKAYEMKPIFTDLLSYYGGPQGAHRMSILANGNDLQDDSIMAICIIN